MTLEKHGSGSLQRSARSAFDTHQPRRMAVSLADEQQPVYNAMPTSLSRHDIPTYEMRTNDGYVSRNAIDIADGFNTGRIHRKDAQSRQGTVDGGVGDKFYEENSVRKSALTTQMRRCCRLVSPDRRRPTGPFGPPMLSPPHADSVSHTSNRTPRRRDESDRQAKIDMIHDLQAQNSSLLDDNKRLEKQIVEVRRALEESRTHHRVIGQECKHHPTQLTNRNSRYDKIRPMRLQCEHVEESQIHDENMELQFNQHSNTAPGTDRHDKIRPIRVLAEEAFQEQTAVRTERAKHEKTKRKLEELRSKERILKHWRKDQKAAIKRMEQDLQVSNAEIKYLHLEMAKNANDDELSKIRVQLDKKIERIVLLELEIESAKEELVESQNNLVEVEKKHETRCVYLKRLEGELSDMKKRNEELERRGFELEQRVDAMEKGAMGHTTTSAPPSSKSSRTLKELVSAVASAGHSENVLDIIEKKLEELMAKNEEQLGKMVMDISKVKEHRRTSTSNSSRSEADAASGGANQ